MSYEWKFNPRPYSDEEAKSLLKKVVSPRPPTGIIIKHHKGYVVALNTIEKELESADRSAAMEITAKSVNSSAVLPGITPVLCCMIFTGQIWAVMVTLPKVLKYWRSLKRIWFF